MRAERRSLEGSEEGGGKWTYKVGIGSSFFTCSARGSCTGAGVL